MTKRWGLGLSVLGAAIGLQLTVGQPRVHACGGLFCNATQPVNQAAERIVFADNGDGSVTALIEIQYSGPANRFSWVLPVPGTPTIKVSSKLALDRLQGATNPQYMLQTTFEEGCPQRGSAGAPTSPNAGVDGMSESDPGVNVLAAGTVGPFDYAVLSVDAALERPATVAINWLEAEGFTIPMETADVLEPYLAEGLNLLAFRLSKGNSSGSIRPIVLTYASDKPFIPIRPTAVAAVDDMGVMVFTVGAARAVPANYKALTLNEALINWFNPMSTYNDVVTAAADEASGQGFVTELAGNTSTVRGVVLNPQDVANWQRISTQNYMNAETFVNDAKDTFGGWDGFQDALLKALPALPADIEVSDFLNCPRCYLNDPRVAFNTATFLRALYEDVYAPMDDTEKLLQSRPYLTRLYTTMSADEMTKDPAFDFNADLPDVSNIHTAQQVIACNGGGFRIELPQGDTIYGPTQGTWPVAVGDGQPAARTIMELAETGMGRTVTDNSDKITQLLIAKIPADAGVPMGGRDAGAVGGRSGGTTADGGGVDGGDAGTASQRDDGCHVAAIGTGAAPRLPAVLLLGLLGAALTRRARRRG